MNEPPEPCEHGNIQLKAGRAWCTKCEADWTARMRWLHEQERERERTHPIEVIGPYGEVARLTDEEWQACSDFLWQRANATHSGTHSEA